MIVTIASLAITTAVTRLKDAATIGPALATTNRGAVIETETENATRITIASAILPGREAVAIEIVSVAIDTAGTETLARHARNATEERLPSLLLHVVGERRKPPRVEKTDPEPAQLWKIIYTSEGEKKR